MLPVRLPSCRLRGDTWTADLRRFGGRPYHSLGLARGADPIEVGAALQRAVDGLRSAAKVGAPTLPGLESPGMTMRELAAMYMQARDFETTAGASWAEDCRKRVAEGIGHLTVAELAAPNGVAVLRRWRDQMWAEGWKPRSVRNVLNFTKAILRWGQDDGRDLTGPIPSLPKFARPGQRINEPDFTTFAEADFRTLREHLFDEALHFQAFKKFLGADRDRWADYIGRRQLYLSWAFYTGAHDEDCNTLRGGYISLPAGRYERHNTKSSASVEPEWFDMPEQLALDCEAELRRRGIARFPPDELVAGGRWAESTRTLNKAVRRLWPGDPLRKSFTFRIARRSTIWEYTIRGWRTHEIAAIVGHVDETMIREVYRRCSQLGIVSPVRVPWTLQSGPHGKPSGIAPVLEFKHG